MLVGFRKHLFEIHWRFNLPPENWLNRTAFYIFAVLTGLNLWRFGKKCSVAGAPVVCMANLSVLTLGAFFIFLTFHIGNKNYLYPLLDGTLKWWELKSYLSLNFFFQAPFLAGWLFIYALIYYGLVRTGREHLALYLTAICAVFYLTFFLQDLAAYGNALLVADCLGVVCLLTGFVSPRPLNWFCLMLPWVWLGVFFLILCPEDHSRTYLQPEVIILTSLCILLFGGTSVLAWRKKFYFAWTWILPFAVAAFLLLTSINYTVAPNFQNLFDIGLMLPRYFLGEFFLAFGLLCAAQLYRHWLPKASLLWLDGISLALIILSLLDLRLSQIMGVRLDWRAIEFGANAKMVWREAQPFLPEMAVGLIIILSLYAILVGLWQRGSVTKPLVAGPGGKFLLLTFLFLGLAGEWIAKPDKVESESALLLIKTSPLFAWTSDPMMSKKTFLETAGQLGLEQMMQRPPGTPTRPRRNLNVVLIFQESSYNKYLSLFDGKENTQPLLSKYSERMELFPNFFSNYAASINARFAALMGLYPVSDYKAFTQNRVNAKSLFEILHGAGYHCSIFDSCFLDYTGFRDFLQGRSVEAMYDADNMPDRQNSPAVAWGLREEETTRAIRNQLQQYATNHETFFLSYFPVAPHNPFDGVPEQFRKFHLKNMGDFTPSYLNELLYLDSCITSILDQLKTSGLLDNTLVIITDDHGEMLGENEGPIGHGWVVTPELTNIPFIIMDPENPGYHLNDTIGSQVDILPTILDLLGIAPPADQLYQGVSLYSADAQAHRNIYLNSAQQYGVIAGSRFISGNRETGTALSATDFSAKVFGITNNAGRTLFPEIQSPNATSPSISEFDKFQENLLKNYSAYCQMIRN